jgi:diguanylate cyclase (GGDEF)-like protein
MFLTAWIIESGWLAPGKNIYFAIPLLLLMFLLPLARTIADLLINRDLHTINQFCKEIKEGNYQVHFNLDNEKEDEDQFIILLRNLTWMSHSLAKRHKASLNLYNRTKQQYHEMKAQAHTDALTNLYNRRYFDYLLQQEAAQAAADKTPISLIFIDCDKFKQINDTLGHHRGDQVLIRLAECIRRSIRLNRDTPFRFGGDEFAILMPETNNQQALNIAHRIHQLYHALRIEETTLSIGVATSNFDLNICRAQAEKLIQDADRKTYIVKKRGGNGICEIFCSPNYSMTA